MPAHPARRKCRRHCCQAASPVAHRNHARAGATGCRAALAGAPEVCPDAPAWVSPSRVPDRVVFEHVLEALVHGSGYERIASHGCSDRRLYLFDTFEGMTSPTEVDTDMAGKAASEWLDQ